MTDFAQLCGEWKCVEFDSSNLENYLSQLGVAWAVRKVAKKCNQTIKLNSTSDPTQGPGLHIITTTTLTTTDDIFYFNVPRQVTTKDGRKSTVAFTVKHADKLDEADEEDQSDQQELEAVKGKDQFSCGKCKVYLHKRERWTDSKGKPQTAKITMRLTDSGQMYARMSCNGVAVDRLHVKV